MTPQYNVVSPEQRAQLLAEVPSARRSHRYLLPPAPAEVEWVSWIGAGQFQLRPSKVHLTLGQWSWRTLCGRKPGAVGLVVGPRSGGQVCAVCAHRAGLGDPAREEYHRMTLEEQDPPPGVSR